MFISNAKETQQVEKHIKSMLLLYLASVQSILSLMFYFAYLVVNIKFYSLMFIKNGHNFKIFVYVMVDIW